MKSTLPIEEREMASNKVFRVSAWRGGTYGLRILKKFLESKDDLGLFFQHRQVVLLLPNGKNVTANITDGFRAGTCCELRCAEIGRWLMEEGYAPWAPEPPPRFFLRHAGGNKFEVTKQTP